MDSQETAGNAAEITDREPNSIKPNPLPSGFRARPQGPPGIPRHPLNNGPVGQPRPRAPLQQVRFDSRPPIGPSNSGQFVQLRPYGPPRPPSGSFPQRPPQQGQNSPTILNPRFPASPVQRPVQQPRPSHPGNYQQAQRPQQPRPEHQNLPQQVRSPEILARSQEIAHRQLQRNESLLNIQQGSPSQDKKPILPRIVVDKMADVDSPKKLQQLENNVSKDKMRENTENDDDDDVVMDEKSPRANGNAQDDLIESKLSKDIVQKRPDTATINGKIGKPDEKDDKNDKEKSAKNVTENDNRLSSMKLDKEEHKESLNKQEANETNQLEEKKLVEDQIITEKENLSTRKVQDDRSSPIGPDVTLSGNSGTPKEQDGPKLNAKKLNEDDKPNETPPKSPLIDKSPVDVNQQELNAPKSADKSRTSTPIDTYQSQNESKSALTPREQNETESKTPTPDKSRTVTTAQINQYKEDEESKPMPKSETKDVSKDEQLLDKPSAPVETNQSQTVLSETPEKSKDDALTQNELKDVTNVNVESGKQKVLEDSQLDTSKPKEVGLDVSSSKKESEPQEQIKVPEAVLSPPETTDEGVKGFDNGQERSLSIKSPSLRPNSPVSPKSPTANEKVEEAEKKTKDPIEQKKQDSKKSATPKGRVLTPMKLNEKSAKKSSKISEIENGSVTNESNAEPTTNGLSDSPMKKSPSKLSESEKRSTAGSPVKSPSKSVKSLPRTPDTPSSTGGQEKKKLPMNKVQVGAAPSPNLKTVRSKIGSLENASYKPGGGKVKIENRKLDFSKAQPKIAAKNEKYAPSGGDKKISQVKLQWNAKPKVGSLDNATYKPGGGDKKIETVKLDFKDKAKPKVGSKDNAKHIPGGGAVKSSATPPKTPQDTDNSIQTLKVDVKAESKIGSLDNVKHKPGGGDKKIFNDTSYLRQTSSNVESLSGSGSQSPVPPGTVAAGKNGLPTSDENLNQEY